MNLKEKIMTKITEESSGMTNNLLNGFKKSFDEMASMIDVTQDNQIEMHNSIIDIKKQLEEIKNILLTQK
jgi:hypothetical protein